MPSGFRWDVKFMKNYRRKTDDRHQIIDTTKFVFKELDWFSFPDLICDGSSVEKYSVPKVD